MPEVEEVAQEKGSKTAIELNGTVLPSSAKVMELWKEGVERRREVDREAWQVIQFINGDHYSVWDPVTRRFRRPDANDGRVRLKINLLKAFWRGEVSTIVESDPIAEAVPSSDSEEDKLAAEAGNKILTHELERLRFKELRGWLARWVTSAGLGYWHVAWDVDKDNVAVEVVPHFEIVVDPSVKNNVREGRWVIRARTITTEDAFEEFGEKFQADSSIQAGVIPEETRGPASTEGRMPKKGVMVYQMWHRPSRKYPEGFVLTLVNGRPVKNNGVVPFPYEHGELPFIDVHHVRIPGRYEGQSMLWDLIPAQKDYNASRSRMAEIRTIMAPKVWAPEGSLDADRMSNIAGDIIFYRPIGPYRPEAISFPAVPPFLFQEADQAYREMQDIAGQHEVSRGQVPASGIPAAGIQALQEKDERKVVTTIQSLEQATAELGRQVLQLVHQFWDAQRAVRVWSENTGSMSIDYFKGANIKDNLDVWVLPGSGIPRSRAQQRQDVISLWRERIIQDPRLVLKLMEFPKIDGLVKVMDADAAQARREHDAIFRAEDILKYAVENYQNHEVHIAEHNEFRKTEAFEAWPDEMRVTLAQHVEEHKSQRLAQAQEQLQEQLALAGGQGAAPPGVEQAAALQGLQGPGEALGAEAGLPAEALPDGAIPGVNAPTEPGLQI